MLASFLKFGHLVPTLGEKTNTQSVFKVENGDQLILYHI